MTSTNRHRVRGLIGKGAQIGAGRGFGVERDAARRLHDRLPRAVRRAAGDRRDARPERRIATANTTAVGADVANAAFGSDVLRLAVD
jgi:hypothetical protein